MLFMNSIFEHNEYKQRQRLPRQLVQEHVVFTQKIKNFTANVFQLLEDLKIIIW